MTGSNAKYFGYGHIAGVCDAAITNLFSPSIPSPPPSPPPHHQHGYPSPPASANSSPQIGKSAQWQAREGIDTPPHSPVASATKDVPELKEFIAYALYRTRLPDDIVFSSLLLLARLKKLYPSARGTASSPHRLFLSALMLASKMSMDDTYSNRSWCIVGQQLFTLPEVNRMERELFGFLNWNCCISRAELEEWKAEWISPEGIIGHIAATLTSSAQTAPRRSNEGKSKPPRSKGEETDRDRQSWAAAAALLQSTNTSSSSSSSSTSTPSSASASPSSPRPASSRRHVRQHACAGYTVASGPHNPMHMRQSSDSSMRSASSSSSSDASASLCASSLGSPRSGGSDSPASSGPWTPESGSEDSLDWNGAAAAAVDAAEGVKPWTKTGGFESTVGDRRPRPVWSS